MQCTNLEVEVDRLLLNSDLVVKSAFRPIYEHFSASSAETDIKTLLPLLQLLVQQVDDYGNYSNLFEEMCDLLAAEEIDKDFSLKIIYQLLHSLKKLNVILCFNKVGDELTTLLLKNIEAGQNTHLYANILTCLKMCSNQSSHEFLSRLWTYCQTAKASKQNVVLQIIVQLYDEFHRHNYDFNLQSQYWSNIVQKLLLSNEAKDRKIAQYLLQNQLEYKQNEQYQYWCVYYNIIVSLETNQSHLILPALQALNLTTAAVTQEILPWQNVLYKRILQQQNLPVLRCIIEHILEHYTCESLDSEVLPYFLNVLNKTAHYNPEAYCLSTARLSTFIVPQRHDDFLKSFCNVNWSSVPLFCLLEAFPTETQCSSFEQLLQLAACIRRLQHTALREQCCALFLEKFECTISQLLLHEYVLFIEALYNLNDNLCLSFWHKFNEKLKCWQEANYTPAVNFTERFYRILAKSADDCINLELIMQSFELLDVKLHGWMRYFFLFFVSNESNAVLLHKFCLDKYAVDLMQVRKLTTVQAVFQAFLGENAPPQEKTYIQEQAVDFFTRNCFKHLQNMELLLYLLENGTNRTLYKLVELLEQVDVQIDKLKLCACLIKSLQQNDLKKFNIHDLKVVDCCLKLSRNLTKDFVLELLKTSDKCAKILSLDIEFEASQYVDLILNDDIVSGDARIESMYTKKSHCFRDCIENILRSSKRNMLIEEVVQLLLEKNLYLSRKKPRYFLDSKEHRQQLIMANSIWILLKETGNIHRYSDQFFHILITQNNQSNVTLLYEDLAAKSVTNLHELCHKFNEFDVIKSTTSLQISMLAVLLAFCKRHQLSVQELEKICLQLLLPFTMGAYFQVRSFSILILQDILQDVDPQNCLGPLMESIEHIKQLQGLDKSNLVRMLLPELTEDCKNLNLDEIILFVTHAPKDLYNNDKCAGTEKLAEVHEQLKNQEQHVEDKNKNVCETSNSINIQRKMQINDLFEESCTLSCTNITQDVEMFVIASLIDKLPNLGGIARTCEVLGIRNLVLHNKLVIDKTDFKSLSMTAEKSLNIIEVKKDELSMFLTGKSNLGYKIIGAEQTSESVNFVNFKFPKKCILLLGHEKEGIPPTLLPFLNTAVEIPQFGKVRSLNVHVTASIFMWEFCKQHIYNFEQ